jgi:imidazolonepropionase-like amidohydrolase
VGGAELTRRGVSGRGLSRRGLLAGAALLPWAARAAPIAGIKNAKILLGDGTRVDGGMRFEGGKIVEVGPSVTDGEDMNANFVFPGFHDAGSSLGLYEIDLEADTHDDQEGSDAVTPQVRVIDGYNPRSSLVAVNRIQGVMGALVVPGGGQLVSGQAAWMRLYGETVADATLQAPAGVVFNLGHLGTGTLPNGPRSRPGAVARIRDLMDAHRPREEKPPADLSKLPRRKRDEAERRAEDDRRAREEEERKKTRSQKVFEALWMREMRAIFRCERADDIVTAIGLTKEFGLDAVLMGCAEGHLVARQIADAKLNVLLGPVTAQPDNFSTLYARYDNARLLFDAGVRFALRQGNPHNLRDIVIEADVAVANGLPVEAALSTVCANGPSFFGLDAGRLGPGCEATFVRVDGDPLQPRTRVTGLWVRGERVPLQSRQTELYERFKVLK